MRAPPLDLLNLLADHHRIVAPNLLRTQLPIVERALVLVGIPVDGAEQTAAPTLEACESDLLAAHATPVLLFALPVLLVLLFVIRGRRSCVCTGPALLTIFVGGAVRHIGGAVVGGGGGRGGVVLCGHGHGRGDGGGRRAGGGEEGLQGGDGGHACVRTVRGVRVDGGGGRAVGWLLFLLQGFLVADRAQTVRRRVAIETTAASTQRLHRVRFPLHASDFESCRVLESGTILRRVGSWTMLIQRTLSS